MRYLWDAEDDYAFDRIRRAALRTIRSKLRHWDCEAATRVHHFIANSRFVRERIQAYYGRDAAVIHPPVDTKFFTPWHSTAGGARGDFYLAAGALVPYKRFDLIIEACKQLDRRLVIAGQGPEIGRLRKMASAKIEVQGAVSDEALRLLYRTARAMIVAAREDFGIMTVEAQACGCPVVGFASGGSTDIVTDGINGVFFTEQHPDEIVEALRRFESMHWPESQVRKQVEKFSRDAFRTTIHKFIEERAGFPAQVRLSELQPA